MPKLRLKITHTHAGVAYPPGHILNVDDHTARWLTERAIGTPVNSEVLPAPEAPAVRTLRTPPASPKE